MLGVYEISIRKVSFETGVPVSDIENHLKKFESDGKIRYAENRVVMLNYLKHQKFNLNMKISAVDCYNDLPNSLKMPKISKLPKDLEGFQTLCQGFGRVRKVEVEVESEGEGETKAKMKGEEKPKKQTPPPPSHKLVIWLDKNCPRVQKLSKPITDNEAVSLIADFGSKPEIIKQVFLDMENFKELNKKYTSANLTFRKWIKRELDKNTDNNTSTIKLSTPTKPQLS